MNPRGEQEDLEFEPLRYTDKLVQYVSNEQALRELLGNFTERTAILMADLSASTKYKQDRGLFEGLVKTCKHNWLVIEKAESHRGVRIKEIGDEVMCRFPADCVSDSVQEAIVTACEVLRQLKTANRTEKSDDEKILSKIAIHFVTQGVAYPPGTRSFDIIGPCVDLAARVVEQVRPEQILVTEDAYRRLSGDARKKLKKKGISFSKSKVLPRLKGIEDKPIVVREVIWDNKERGIGRPRIQALTTIKTEASYSFEVLGKLRNALSPSVLVGGGVMYGERSIFLRLETSDLAEYREQIVGIVQAKISQIRMTYSSFIFPNYIYGGKRKQKNRPINALLRIHATPDTKASYAIFAHLKDLAEDPNTAKKSGLSFDTFDIVEAGVTFGEHEVYAIIGAATHLVLSEVVRKGIQSCKQVSMTNTAPILRGIELEGDTFFWRPSQLL